jgi:anti-sigma factor RsiW
MSDTPPATPISPGAQMSCTETRPYLSAYADGELAEPLRSQVARHLAGCAECAARVEGYRSTDALLASLPATMPSPEVFHAVMAAAREENAAPVEHETLASPFAGLMARRPRLVRPEPRQQDGPAIPGARRKSWIATVAPAVAAVLLVSLAALAFRGLVMAPRDVHPASTPTATGTILERTQAQVAEVARTTQLPFTPVVPGYAPNGASKVDISLGYANDDKTVIYLDIVWTVTSSAFLRKIRIREFKSGYEYQGYSPDTSENAKGWRLLNDYGWQPLKNDSIGQISGTSIDTSVAVGERRGNTLSIAVEAVGTSPLASVDRLMTTLRQVTLSMDGQNKPILLASRPPTGLVLHYVAQSQVTGGQTPAWSAEVYVNPATDAQNVAVSANGKPRYVDVSHGSQGYRWDPQTNTYATGPRSQFSGNMALEVTGNDNVLQIFRDPYTLLQTGLLWYSGQNTKLPGGTNAYDYILVSAPNKTHVYIDPQTNQVVQVKVETNVLWSYPPQTDQVFGQDHCSYFTLIEYAQPEGVADKFSPAPPPGSHQNQSGVPATVRCS